MAENSNKYNAQYFNTHTIWEVNQVRDTVEILEQTDGANILKV